MRSIEEIRRYKDYFVGDLYTAVRGHQGIDQSFIEDTFNVPQVKTPHTLIRSGIGYHVVSSPSEQIITSSPQAFLSTDKKTNQESANNLAKEINQVWVENLKRQIPNIFKELVKNKLSRGESYISLLHNQKWVTGDKQRYGMPVLFSAPDPMIIYGSPDEDDCGWTPNVGVPNRVVVSYERQPLDVLLMYPNWTNPEGRELYKTEPGNMVDFWAYFDKDCRYFEADGQPVLQGGVQPNIYGFTPFVRKYSGFGKRSPEGKLEDLIFSDIRMSRDLIREECAIRSDIASIMHIFAHKPITITLPEDATIDESKLRTSLDMGSYSVNLLYLPEGSQVSYGDTILPSAEAYQHLRDIRAEINQRHPFIMSGFPMGSSGRQQDMSQSSAMRRYDTVLENTEEEFATAFEMALRMLKVPGLRSDNIKKTDLAVDVKCDVKLRAADPVEDDRLATLGSRLYAQGEISLETNLIKYQKYIQSEADEEIINILVEKVTLGSPEIAELMGLKAAEKAGMAEDLQMLRQRRQQLEQNLGQPVSQSEMRQRVGEVTTETGREMGLDFSNRGQRRPPTRFTRG